MASDSLITIHSLLGNIYHGLVTILTMILPLLEKAIVPLVTVGGTLGGVYWAQKGQREIKKMELIHQVETDKTKIKRDRLHLIFDNCYKYEQLFLTANNAYEELYRHPERISFFATQLAELSGKNNAYYNICCNSDLYFPSIYEYFKNKVTPKTNEFHKLTICLNVHQITKDDLNKRRTCYAELLNEFKKFKEIIKEESNKLID